jgi:hypothetical protein
MVQYVHSIEHISGEKRVMTLLAQYHDPNPHAKQSLAEGCCEVYHVAGCFTKRVGLEHIFAALPRFQWRQGCFLLARAEPEGQKR